MARLNEPPAATESIDSLKRRFVRQNRDLARCNSQQSIKIRALETDLHHCLSENATLRTRILALESELSDTRTLDIRSGVAQLRNRLTSQFALIVAELTQLEKKPKRRKSQLQLPVSPKRSPQRREWRNSSTLGEVLASQGATLPTIVEDKHFPRKTLDAVDLQRLIADADADSPEVGPPPRTFLDRELSPDGETRLQSPKTQSPEENANRERLFDAVEIRRRRRSSKLRNEDGSNATDLAAHPLRAGAKRKVDFVEAREPPVLEPSPRKVLGDKSVNTDSVVISPQKSPQKLSKPYRNPSKPITARPAPSRPSSQHINRSKSVSRPPTRPAWASAQPTITSIDTTKPKAEPITRPPAPEPNIPPPNPSSINIKTEPRTPHALAIFSPISVETSAPPSATECAPTRPLTPPPSSMKAGSTSASTDDTGAGGRGSRRGGKPAVSYAEPKLNSKMRRDGKEMADAVVGGVKREVGRSVSREPDSNSVPTVEHKVRIKLEDEVEGNAEKKDEEGEEKRPASPLDHREHQPQPPQQLLDVFEVEGTPPAVPNIINNKRSTTPTSASPSPKTNKPSTAAPTATRPLSRSSSTTAITNTTASVRGPRRERRQTLASTSTDESSTISPGIANIHLSQDPNSQAPTQTQRELRVRSTARRTSSISSLSLAKEKQRDGERDVGAANLRAERAGRIAERRKSMML